VQCGIPHSYISQLTRHSSASLARFLKSLWSTCELVFVAICCCVSTKSPKIIYHWKTLNGLCYTYTYYKRTGLHQLVRYLFWKEIRDGAVWENSLFTAWQFIYLAVRMFISALPKMAKTHHQTPTKVWKFDENWL